MFMDASFTNNKDLLLQIGYILVLADIINKFIKWGYFIIYTKEILVEDIAQIYIKEIFIRYRAPAKIILDRDTRFIIVF